MARPERFELEPFCGGERSGRPQAKSRAQSRDLSGERESPAEIEAISRRLSPVPNAEPAECIPSGAADLKSMARQQLSA
jgi:hypothetical protein